MAENKFQVNLRGMIALLSDHLYSTPQVFVRELLQNAHDAITARQTHERNHQGEVRIEIASGQKGGPATLTIQDNGIGLSESEVREFLATIGNSSKQGVLEAEDYLGQFGIGLLSAFVVSDEIAVVTKSVNENAPAVEWRGRADGSYTLRTLDIELEPGTQVFLRSREDASELFSPENFLAAARRFGAHLPTPIIVTSGSSQELINEEPPWGLPSSLNAQEQRERWLQYGRETLGTDFLDVFPISSEAGGVEGVAYLSPRAASAPAKQAHRVYLKGMLVSESIDELLPSWAFFVRCVVNTTSLKPTASRESFLENQQLSEARETLGECIRGYLLQLAKYERAKLDAILAIHHLPIKALAVDDDDFYRIVIGWLPFETSLGRMTLNECLRTDPLIRFSPTYDQFRQISSVAAAQGFCVINAGFTYDSELLEKLPVAFPERRCEQVDIEQLVDAFEPLSLEERDGTHDLARLADLVLQPYRCSAQVQKFSPTELPTLYTANDASTFLRSIEQTQEETNQLWSSILGNVAENATASAYAQLTLNYNNPLIKRLAEISDKNLVGRAVEMLYIQSLLLGHFPLGPKESSLLGQGVLGLIEYALKGSQESEGREHE
ncbi:HSP90 family protein [Adhaeretor mobilis]|uniref:HSP90 family protein n=1 Tax=Adhaeretor mobilis TaxID=1930276 RepID=UPI001C54D5B8|nr:HSP90 family protein [Adhaeretor mobilis]